MAKRRRRQNGHQNKGRPARRPDEKLADAQFLIEQAAHYFNRGQNRRGYQQLRYLRENQGYDSSYFCKSLCTLSTKTYDLNLRLEFLKEAFEIDPSDTVTLSSYGTALAQGVHYSVYLRLYRSLLQISSSFVMIADRKSVYFYCIKFGVKNVR